MEILHVSAECYPMAKAGGLADVVGALPKYQNRLGHFAKVIMPMHRTKFLYENNWEVAHKGSFSMDDRNIEFTIIKEATNKLGFDLYCVDINGLLDREKIYGHEDDAERFLAFQIAVCEWISRWEHKLDILHVHDHHASLLPFMIQHCNVYQHISYIKTILTIHNAQYQGWMGWHNAALMPSWNTWKWGLLDWDKLINPLAAGVRCAHNVTTVSPSYMKELQHDANGLETLMAAESYKCRGVLNGIDFEVWNPDTDAYLTHHFNSKTFKEGKEANKEKLCDEFGFDKNLPLFIFIGRLVEEKSADMFPAFLEAAFSKFGDQFSFLILGSGDKRIEEILSSFNYKWLGFFNARIQYNETLSHEMYAGADFLFMPSRVEPCGLNQMYAMRYGTVPVVRRIGGLQDTVIDFEDENGFGICFQQVSIVDMLSGMDRGIQLFKDSETLTRCRKRMMAVNNSWDNSAAEYINIYNGLLGF